MSKVAFVTGGTGFVGSHLVEALIQQDYSEVRCLVRSEPKWLTGLDVVQIPGTLEDFSLTDRALKGVDMIYHLGAMTRAKTWATLYEANVTDTMNLMAAAETAGISKICIVSSLAVVGNSGKVIANESTPCKPVSMYGRSKLAMEQALADMNLPLVILRPCVVYGPRDQDLLTFFSAIYRGICAAPRRDPGLSLVYVKDLVRGMIQAAESPRTAGETYCVGNDQVVSWNALKRSSESALEKKSLMIRLPRSLIMPIGMISEFAGKLSRTYPALNREKAGEILYATKQCSSAKATDHFGYVPEVLLDDGIRETIAWYRTQGWI